MTLSELIAEVYTITNRPDMVAATLTAVRSATLKVHQTDFYFKDLFETGVSFEAASYTQQLEYHTLVPRWRALKYFRKTDITGTEQGAFFTVVVPENVLDSYGMNRTDVCYMAGLVIQLKSSTQFQYGILGCYLHPDITATTYTSWIASEYPFAIIYDAAATLFKMFGDSEQYAVFTALAQQQIGLIRMSNIQAVGY